MYLRPHCPLREIILTKKIIIIGAGPAGISAAYTLSKQNIGVEIFESSSDIGGMSKSFDLWGQRVDLGPHRFFSKEPIVNTFFNEIIKEEYTIVNRLTRIYYKNKYFDYPLRLFNVLQNLRIDTIANVLLDYSKQKLFPIKNPNTFEKWVTNRFGKKLYTIFFKHYTEKLWGIPCSKIDADWAAQRIKNLSLYEAVISALKRNKGNTHKTLVDQFAYPKGGTGSLYEKAINEIEKLGGVVHVNTPVQKLIIENNVCKGVISSDGNHHYADHVISSMPLTLLLKGINDVPKPVIEASEKLYFRNTILVYLEVQQEDLFEDNWIYIHSPDVKHGRITNFRNWCPSLNRDKKSSILCLEFWAFEDEELWTASDNFLTDLAIKELLKLNLISSENLVDQSKIIRVPKCYPVYEIGYYDHLKKIETFLDTIDGITPIGRYGSFKYNNQDHSILMGILAAENLLYNKNVNLWEINTDTDYQEDGDIKDVLVQ